MIVGGGGGSEWRRESYYLMGIEFQLRKKVLEMDAGDVCSV